MFRKECISLPGTAGIRGHIPARYAHHVADGPKAIRAPRSRRPHLCPMRPGPALSGGSGSRNKQRSNNSPRNSASLYGTTSGKRMVARGVVLTGPGSRAEETCDCPLCELVAYRSRVQGCCIVIAVDCAVEH